MKNTVLALAILFSLSVSAQPAAGPATSGSPETEITDAKPDAIQTEKMGAIKKARVFFIEPKNGATVPQKFTVKMGVEGLKVRAAGEDPDDMTSGHHHLIINGKPIGAGVPVPADDKHMHFGKGETETTLNLKPGKHTLILQFADGAHRSFGPKLMQKIEITVK